MKNFENPKIIIFKKNELFKISYQAMVFSIKNNEMIIPVKYIKMNSFLYPKLIIGYTFPQYCTFKDTLKIKKHIIKGVEYSIGKKMYLNSIDITISKNYLESEFIELSLFYKNKLLKKQKTLIPQRVSNLSYVGENDDDINSLVHDFIYPFGFKGDTYSSLNIKPEFTKKFIKKMENKEYRDLFEMISI